MTPRRLLTAPLATILVVLGLLGSLAAFADVDPSMSLAIAATPTPAATPIPETADPSVAIPLVLKLVEAVEEGRWAVAAGFALMILTFLALRIPQVRGRVPKDYTATFLLGMSLLGSFGAALASGTPPGRAALAGLVCSSLAIAFYEGVFRHLVKLWDKATSPAVGGGA